LFTIPYNTIIRQHISESNKASKEIFEEKDRSKGESYDQKGCEEPLWEHFIKAYVD